MKIMTYLGFITLMLSCQPQMDNNIPKAKAAALQTSDQWSDYWYGGEAEISVYKGLQTRYSERHPASAVLIFVTEDFLTDKQVKNEAGSKRNSTSVLKTNLSIDFTTGIYDYNIMSSVFTPIDVQAQPHTLKITTSSQDWCGHSFVQLNHAKRKYDVKLFSYFEKEGDDHYTVSDVMTEDEIMNRIRMNPDALPVGVIQIIPGTIFGRLKHVALRPVSVKTSNTPYLLDDMSGENLRSYILNFESMDRTLEIIYEDDFPHAITGWKDSYPTVISGEKLTTLYKRVSTIKSPYWSQHDLEHLPLRAEIGLD